MHSRALHAFCAPPHTMLVLVPYIFQSAVPVQQLQVARFSYWISWGSERPLISSDSMHESTHTTATRHAPRIAPMVALARGLGAACRISVARLRPAESDVRGRSSTWSRTFGAVRQVRGGAEAGFWVVCWVARGSARQLAAAGSGSGAAERGRGALCRVSPWAGDVW